MKVPYFRAKDKDTGLVVEGFYFEYPATTYCFAEDYASFKVPLIPCIVSYRMIDWGLPNQPILCNPIDKDSLELIGYIDTETDYYNPTEGKWVEKL